MTEISDRQKAIHVIAEFVAVGLVAPFLFYVATRSELPRWTRIGAGTIATATVAVDGYLLSRYLKTRRALAA